MQVVHERCCGRDVPKKTVVACVITPAGKQTRPFGPMTRDVLARGQWLLGHGVTHGAMESSGVYWTPVSTFLEGMAFQRLVANAQPSTAVPGRKTDGKDAEGRAELLRHGLIRGSDSPERWPRERQAVVRHRTSLIRLRGPVVQRSQTVLEGATIKLAAVAPAVVGVSGRALREAMGKGGEDPAALAGLARGRLTSKQQ